MCELQSGMKIGDKGNVLLKFNAATTRDAYHIDIVDVSLNFVAGAPHQYTVDRFVLLHILQKYMGNLGPFFCQWPPLPLDGRIRC